MWKLDSEIEKKINVDLDEDNKDKMDPTKVKFELDEVCVIIIENLSKLSWVILLNVRYSVREDEEGQKSWGIDRMRIC